MFIEKIIIITSVLLVFSGAVLAQGASQSYRSKVKFEYGPAFEAIDTNKDGKVSFEEYAAANNGRAALMTSGGASAPPPTNHGGAAGGAPQGGSTSAEQK